MRSNIIKAHLQDIKGQKEVDVDFVDLLTDSNEKNEDGKETAAKILNLIKRRYAQSRENNS